VVLMSVRERYKERGVGYKKRGRENGERSRKSKEKKKRTGGGDLRSS